MNVCLYVYDLVGMSEEPLFIKLKPTSNDCYANDIEGGFFLRVSVEVYVTTFLCFIAIV